MKGGCAILSAVVFTSLLTAECDASRGEVSFTTDETELSASVETQSVLSAETEGTAILRPTVYVSPVLVSASMVCDLRKLPYIELSKDRIRVQYRQYNDVDVYSNAFWRLN